MLYQVTFIYIGLIVLICTVAIIIMKRRHADIYILGNPKERIKYNLRVELLNNITRLKHLSKSTEAAMTFETKAWFLSRGAEKNSVHDFPQDSAVMRLKSLYDDIQIINEKIIQLKEKKYDIAKSETFSALRLKAKTEFRIMHDEMLNFIVQKSLLERMEELYELMQ